MRIGQVAEQSGYSISTLRYYESLGLIPEPSRVSGQRDYDAQIFETLAVIRAAQRAGFSLDEIRQLIDNIGADVSPSAVWHELASVRSAQIERQINDLQQQQAYLQQGMDCQCETLRDCPLL